MLAPLLKASGIVVLCLASVKGTWTDPTVLDACPGYKATNVKSHGATLTADLELAGIACNIYGNDAQKLSLSVKYETGASRVNCHCALALAVFCSALDAFDVSSTAGIYRCRLSLPI
jgi:hypothetical protein